jgi:fucose 4-O-acetylase-like acetyltransferase
MRLDLTTEADSTTTIHPQFLTENLNANLGRNKPSKPNYPFIDFVRLISMMGIVWVHLSIIPGDIGQYINSTNHPFTIISFTQLGKFDVICFFVISGFLLEGNIKQNKAAYFKRRLNTIAKPYIFVCFLYVIFLLVRNTYIKHLPVNSETLLSIYRSIIGSHLWFVPNFLTALGIILLCYRYVKSKGFGLVLALITLTYSILTVYTHHFASNHTSALFGFIFYLWLGIYVKEKNLIEKINAFNLPLLAFITILLYSLASAEACMLFEKHLIYYNNLRIFNQLYSLSIFCLLVRICKNRTLNFKYLNPRKETFGIYLYHGFSVSILIPMVLKYIFKYYHYNYLKLPVTAYVLIFPFMFAIGYVLTVITVRILLRLKIGFLN